MYRKSEDAEHESHFKEVSEIEQEKLVEVQQNRDLTSLDTRYWAKPFEVTSYAFAW